MEGRLPFAPSGLFRESPSIGKRNSDPRHRPWQGRALPTELFPRGDPRIAKYFKIVKGYGPFFLNFFLIFCDFNTSIPSQH